AQDRLVGTAGTIVISRAIQWIRLARPPNTDPVALAQIVHQVPTRLHIFLRITCSSISLSSRVQVSHQPLQPRVLFLNLAQPLHLRWHQPTYFLRHRCCRIMERSNSLEAPVIWNSSLPVACRCFLLIEVEVDGDVLEVCDCPEQIDQRWPKVN